MNNDMFHPAAHQRRLAGRMKCPLLVRRKERPAALPGATRWSREAPFSRQQAEAEHADANSRQPAHHIKYNTGWQGGGNAAQNQKINRIKNKRIYQLKFSVL